MSEGEATMGGIEALEFETVLPLIEHPGSSFTVRTRYMVSEGWLYGLRVSGVLDEAAERTWKQVVESFELEDEALDRSGP